MIEYRELPRVASDTIPTAASLFLSISIYLSFSISANLRRGFRSQSRKIRGKSKSGIKGAPEREINRDPEGLGRVR